MRTSTHARTHCSDLLHSSHRDMLLQLRTRVRIYAGVIYCFRLIVSCHFKLVIKRIHASTHAKKHARTHARTHSQYSLAVQSVPLFAGDSGGESLTTAQRQSTHTHTPHIHLLCREFLHSQGIAMKKALHSHCVVDTTKSVYRMYQMQLETSLPRC